MHFMEDRVYQMHGNKLVPNSHLKAELGPATRIVIAARSADISPEKICKQPHCSKVYGAVYVRVPASVSVHGHWFDRAAGCSCPQQSLGVRHNDLSVRLRSWNS
jgi:hypothetical protein